jgi:hypothetical protein
MSRSFFIHSQIGLPWFRKPDWLSCLSARRHKTKAALLQAYQAAQKAAEPTREARQKERMALADARDKRRALREQEKREEQAQLEAQAPDRRRRVLPPQKQSGMLVSRQKTIGSRECWRIRPRAKVNGTGATQTGKRVKGSQGGRALPWPCTPACRMHGATISNSGMAGTALWLRMLF